MILVKERFFHEATIFHEKYKHITKNSNYLFDKRFHNEIG
jgi:hypothetical protein